MSPKTKYMRDIHSNILLGQTLLLATMFKTGEMYDGEYSFVGTFLVLVIGIFVSWFYDSKFDRNYKSPLIKVHKSLISRYTEMLKTKQYVNGEIRISKMLKTLEENINSWSDDKTSRWIGFIQYFMIENNFTTVDAERDFSRPLFKKAYKKLGLSIPKTIDLSKD